MIKSLPYTEQPRERLEKYGVSSLSLIEILSLILKSGNDTDDVFSLSHKIAQILEKEGQLVSLPRLTAISGIGKAKGCQILAALELGKRISTLQKKHSTITCARDIYEFIAPYFLGVVREEFVVMYLSTQLSVIGFDTVFVGSLDQITIHAREIFFHAIKHLAHSIVIIHNHPSGNASPSDNDIILTKQLKRAGDLLNIPVLDHIIVGENSYWSYEENKNTTL